MPEAPADPGREKRVIGIFVLMIGAGLIVDAALISAGAILILAGAGLLFGGMTHRTAPTAGSETPAVAAPRWIDEP